MSANLLAAESLLKFDNVFARATPPGAFMGAVYGDITNVSETSLEISKLSTHAAGFAEIHESVEIEGMMRMREVTPLIIAPGETIKFEPGAKHIMLMRLQAPLKKGSTFTIDVKSTDGTESATNQVQVLVGGFGQLEMPN